MNESSLFPWSDAFRIPVEDGQAVDAGWTAATGYRPLAVTWHWTATPDLATCTELLGGGAARRKGRASAHYAIGRSFAEGVHRYVSLADRSWHAGKNQRLRWNGEAHDRPELKGARTSIGVETVNLGFARRGLPARPGWLRADSADGRFRMRVQPWTEEQVTMMIAVGREIVARWPGIGPRDHHGHHDLCPDYKRDVAGFPFARVLRGIYDDPEIPDLWSPTWTVGGRQRALASFGYKLGSEGAEKRWGPRSDDALRRFQEAHALVVNGWWTTFVDWRIHDLRGGPSPRLGAREGDFLLAP